MTASYRIPSGHWLPPLSLERSRPRYWSRTVPRTDLCFARSSGPEKAANGGGEKAFPDSSAVRKSMNTRTHRTPLAPRASLYPRWTVQVEPRTESGPARSLVDRILGACVDEIYRNLSLKDSEHPRKQAGADPDLSCCDMNDMRPIRASVVQAARAGGDPVTPVVHGHYPGRKLSWKVLPGLKDSWLLGRRQRAELGTAVAQERGDRTDPPRKWFISIRR